MPDENEQLPDNAGDAADAMAGLLGDENSTDEVEATPSEATQELEAQAGMTAEEAMQAERDKHAADNEAKVAATKQRLEDEAAQAEEDEKNQALERAIANNMEDEAPAEGETADPQKQVFQHVAVDNKPRVRAKEWSPDVAISVTCNVNGETKTCDLIMRNAAGQVLPNQYNAQGMLGIMAGLLKGYSGSVEVVPMKQEADAA